MKSKRITHGEHKRQKRKDHSTDLRKKESWADEIKNLFLLFLILFYKIGGSWRRSIESLRRWVTSERVVGVFHVNGDDDQ